MPQEIYQQQFSVSKLLLEGWKKYREHFKSIVMITLLIYIPINIILNVVSSTLSAQDSFKAMIFDLRLTAFLYLSLGVISTMAIAHLIKHSVDGVSINTQEAIKKSFSRWWPAVSTSVVLYLFLFGLALLLVVPAIIFFVYWIFAIFAVALNGVSDKKALDYSKSIVKGRWWSVWWYIIAFGVLQGLTQLIVSYLFPQLLPKSIFIGITFDTLASIASAFFTVVFILFFINFDATKAVKKSSIQ